MAQANITEAIPRFGQTARRDAWWARPLVVFTTLSLFVIYTTWAAFQGEYYAHGNYLSPLYSPELFGDSPHNIFGPKPGWWPGFMPWSPALLILWAPGLFRLTCYYYRGAYYKSFMADPVACAVSEHKRKYSGERSFPLILQNVHRYFMYIAVAFILILAHDAWKAMWFIDPATGAESFGIGVGTLVLSLNVVFLGGYTLGCHSLRHAVGGIKDIFSRNPVRFKMYKCVTCLNQKHMVWAWMSLFWVAFTDIYVRLCAMGIWTDWKILL